ncbi:AraC family transcriptional regulator [Georgenia yuyongxinii]|uniref:AraC family transcriptional regulator n=1 Tax=Georgenia yuyongxinii TaxID=2589797 RepID=A0A5B8C327_9MICO|nr:AraC family transcriptional regulator [Georgenia yuyongxinii]
MFRTYDQRSGRATGRSLRREVQRVSEAVRGRLELATRDVDVARVSVGELFCPHRLEPRSDGRGVDLTLKSVRLGGLAIVELDYGETVDILPGELSTFYLVQIPLRGTARIEQGRDELVSDLSTASVLSPVDPIRMTWRADNPQLLVYVDRALLESELTRLVGRRAGRPLVFDLGMPTRTPQVRSWLRAVRFLWDEAGHEGSILEQRATADAFSRALTAQLLETQPHTFTDAIRPVRLAPPSVARRAVDHIEAHLGEPLAVGDIADEVGTSTRALQEAFRREFDTTPVAFVRELRLTRAHEMLRRAEPGTTTVTEVAMGLGITHLGRFSVHYNGRYGESPSATLWRR